MLTRCPYCGTTFRVTPEQLKVRQGQVRCGQCRRVFDALRALAENAARAQQAASRPQEAQPASGPAPEPHAELTWTIVQPAPPGAETAGTPVAGAGFAYVSGEESAPKQADEPPTGFEPVTAKSVAEASFQPVEPEAPATPELPGMPTEPIARPVEETVAEAPIEEITIEAPPGPPLESEAEAVAVPTARGPETPLPPEAAPEPEPEPRFDPILADLGPPTILDLHEAPSGTGLRWPWVLGSLFALLLLAAQLLLHYRTELIAMAPDSRPVFVAACELLGCRIDLPHKIDLIGIESSDLAPDDKTPGTLYLAATLRNRAPYVQAWPHLEITLTDAQERPLLRRALAPGDYLPTGIAAADGFPARGEQVVQLTLAAPGIPAVGYRLYVFHP
jgi:predicted Zn finger-like uncharacterized protein